MKAAGIRGALERVHEVGADAVVEEPVARVHPEEKARAHARRARGTRHDALGALLREDAGAAGEDVRHRRGRHERGRRLRANGRRHEAIGGRAVERDARLGKIGDAHELGATEDEQRRGGEEEERAHQNDPAKPIVRGPATGATRKPRTTIVMPDARSTPPTTNAMSAAVAHMSAWLRSAVARV